MGKRAGKRVEERSWPMHWQHGDPRDGLLRRYHSRGYSGSEIASELNCCASTVWKAMRRLGLKPWRSRGPRRARRRREEQSVAAALLGWPQVRWKREALLLQVLWDAGRPLTRKEVWERWYGKVCTRRYPGSVDAIALAAVSLCRLGLVERSKRQAIGGHNGGGRPLTVYSLVPGVSPVYVKDPSIRGSKSQSDGPRVYRVCR